MANISPSTKEEIKSFESMEWLDADTINFGAPVEWLQKDFVFKAEEDGIIIGSIYGHIEEGVLDIKGVIVARDKKGKGIGKQLMERAEQFGKENNAHKAHIITGIGWTTVENFYRACGFSKVAELKNHFLHKDFAIYEKPL